MKSHAHYWSSTGPRNKIKVVPTTIMIVVVLPVVIIIQHIQFLQARFIIYNLKLYR